MLTGAYASVAAASPRSARRPSSAHYSGSPALRKPSLTIGRAGAASAKNLIVS